MKGYYFITDAKYSAAGVIHDVREAMRAGTRMVQYREKSAETRAMYDEARVIRELCAGSGARLIINDRVDIALAVDADGIHIGREDMPYGVARRILGEGKIIGMTVHTLDEALAAEREGADYLGVSPIFATGTKSDAGEPCGLETLEAIRRACRIPIAAIGGIGLENAGAVVAAGADMVCAISAVVTGNDVAAAISKFQRKCGL